MYKEKAAGLLKRNMEAIVNSGAALFTISELEQLGLHPSFIKYLWAEEMLLTGESGGTPPTFGKSELLIRLKKAAVFNLNYLFNPVSLIKKQLFLQPNLSIDERINDLKNRTYYYRYYVDIIDKLHKSGKIEESSFDETMVRVNEKLFKNNFVQIITDGVDALSHFLNFGEEPASLDINCMKFFLLSRGLSAQFAKLEPRFEGKETLSVWKIKDILTGNEQSVFDSSFENTRLIKNQSPTLAPLKPEELPGGSTSAVVANSSGGYAGGGGNAGGAADESRATAVTGAPHETGTSQETGRQETTGTSGVHNIAEFIQPSKKKVEFEPVTDPGIEVPTGNRGSSSVADTSEAEEIIASLPSIHDDTASGIFEEEKVQRFEYSFPPRVDSKISGVFQRKNLLSLLNEDESLKIIQHIFDGDHNDFFGCIERIDRCRSITE
ncbi:MAG: hypothetical protein B6D45_00055, partial [Ignavibacteriales bacterium UTCHB3]